MTVGGQSRPGGRAVTVTRSGAEVGSAQVPGYSSKYYGSGRARKKEEVQKNDEASRLKAAQANVAKQRAERAAKLQAARDKARQERQTRGVRQSQTDEFTQLRRQANESPAAYAKRKEKVIRAAELTQKQSIVRPEDLNRVEPGTPNTQARNANVEIPMRSVTIAQTKTQQYQQAIKEKGIVRGSLYFLGEKAQGFVAQREVKGDLGFKKGGPSITSNNLVSTAVQTGPYFVPGLGTALLVSGGAEALGTKAGRARTESYGTTISEKTRTPQWVGTTTAYGLEIAGATIGTVQTYKAMKVGQPKTTLLDVQTKTSKLPERTVVNVQQGTVTKTPKNTMVVESTVLARTEKGFVNPSSTLTVTKSQTLVTKEGDLIRTATQGRSTSRTSYGQKNTVATDYLSGKKSSATTKSRGEFQLWYDTKQTKDYVGYVVSQTGSQTQAGVAGLKVMKDGGAVYATTKPVVQEAYKTVLKGDTSLTTGLVVSKKRVNDVLRAQKPVAKPKAKPQKPITLDISKDRASGRTTKLTVQEAKTAAVLSSLPSTPTKTKTVIRAPRTTQTTTQPTTLQVTPRQQTVSTQQVRYLTNTKTRSAQRGLQGSAQVRKEKVREAVSTLKKQGSVQSKARTFLQQMRQKTQKTNKQSLRPSITTLLRNRLSGKPKAPLPLPTPQSTTSTLQSQARNPKGSFDIVYGVSRQERTPFTGSLEAAFEKALKESRSTLKAGFAITKRGSTKPLSTPKSLPQDFRPSKTLKGFTVQKKGRRLGTRSEVKEILSATRKGRKRNSFL